MINRRSLITTSAAVAAVPVAASAQDAPAGGAQPGAARAASPEGVISVELKADNDGFVSYSVNRLGRQIIAPSRLGFLLTDARKLERAFGILDQAVASHDETWEQPWGERRFIRNRYNELRVQLQERWGLMRRMDVVFRLYDDGLGFRYEFPEQPELKTVNIGAELTEFTVADPGTAWWLPAFEYNRAEYLYNRTDIDSVGVSQTPLTMRLEDGTHLSIHEAALVDYSGMNLRRVEGGSSAVHSGSSALFTRVNDRRPSSSIRLLCQTNAPSGPVACNASSPGRRLTKRPRRKMALSGSGSIRSMRS